MNSIRHYVSDPAANASGPSVAAPVPTDDDPLSHLYRMSRTAGLGSGDYASINPLAVASLFFGIAGILVIYGRFLLVVPGTAFILAVLALRQIRNSNGTQVGTWIALLGLLLSAIFGGWQLASGAIDEVRTRADRAAIAGVIDHLGRDASAMNLDDAYE